MEKTVFTKEQLKARAYDLLVSIQNMQVQLQNINNQISEYDSKNPTKE
jgi:hypothetical protein